MVFSSKSSLTEFCSEQYCIASFPQLKHPSGMSANWSQSSLSMHSQPPASENEFTQVLQPVSGGGVVSGSKIINQFLDLSGFKN